MSSASGSESGESAPPPTPEVSPPISQVDSAFSDEINAALHALQSSASSSASDELVIPEVVLEGHDLHLRMLHFIYDHQLISKATQVRVWEYFKQLYPELPHAAQDLKVMFCCEILRQLNVYGLSHAQRVYLSGLRVSEEDGAEILGINDFIEGRDFVREMNLDMFNLGAGQLEAMPAKLAYKPNHLVSAVNPLFVRPTASSKAPEDNADITNLLRDVLADIGEDLSDETPVLERVKEMTLSGVSLLERIKLAPTNSNAFRLFGDLAKAMCEDETSGAPPPPPPAAMPSSEDESLASEAEMAFVRQMPPGTTSTPTQQTFERARSDSIERSATSVKMSPGNSSGSDVEKRPGSEARKKKDLDHFKRVLRHRKH